MGEKFFPGKVCFYNTDNEFGLIQLIESNRPNDYHGSKANIRLVHHGDIYLLDPKRFPCEDEVIEYETPDMGGQVPGWRYIYIDPILTCEKKLGITADDVEKLMVSKKGDGSRLIDGLDTHQNKIGIGLSPMLIHRNHMPVFLERAREWKEAQDFPKKIRNLGAIS